MNLIEKGPKNYMSSLAIRTTCTTLKWVSKYDFIFANKEFFFSKITLYLSFQKSLSFGVNHNQPSNETNLIKMGQRMPQRYECSGTHLHLSNGYLFFILIFKLIFHFFYIAFIRGLSNLGLQWPEVEKKGPKNYMTSLVIKTTCSTLKRVSKYDFIFANWEFFFSKINFIGG